MSQRRLFKETREQRCQRILSGVPKLKRASSMLFDYERATKQARIPTAHGGHLSSRGGVVSKDV